MLSSLVQRFIHSNVQLPIQHSPPAFKTFIAFTQQTLHRLYCRIFGWL